jgi:hypothetical protein
LRTRTSTLKNIVDSTHKIHEIKRLHVCNSILKMGWYPRRFTLRDKTSLASRNLKNMCCDNAYRRLRSVNRLLYKKKKSLKARLIQIWIYRHWLIWVELNNSVSNKYLLSARRRAILCYGFKKVIWFTAGLYFFYKEKKISSSFIIFYMVITLESYFLQSLFL